MANDTELEFKSLEPTYNWYNEPICNSCVLVNSSEVRDPGRGEDKHPKLPSEHYMCAKISLDQIHTQEDIYTHIHIHQMQIHIHAEEDIFRK